jgi:hypothetical protein
MQPPLQRQPTRRQPGPPAPAVIGPPPHHRRRTATAGDPEQPAVKRAGQDDLLEQHRPARRSGRRHAGPLPALPAVARPVHAGDTTRTLLDRPRVLRAKEIAGHQTATGTRHLRGQGDPPVPPAVGTAQHDTGSVLVVERPRDPFGGRQHVRRTRRPANRGVMGPRSSRDTAGDGERQHRRADPGDDERPPPAQPGVGYQAGHTHGTIRPAGRLQMRQHRPNGDPGHCGSLTVPMADLRWFGHNQR